MVYTNQVKKALILAYNAHKEQLDKGGMPYIFHPFFVAMHLEDENEVTAALLHDVCEDTDITVEELEKQGFGKEVTEALRLLTHESGTDYMEYIRGLKHNKIAKNVKLWDLKHNSMLSRLDNVTQRDIERAEKYAHAIKILEE